MNNMLVRAISGAVYIAVIVGAILGGALWFWALTLVFSILGMVELQKLLSTRAPMSVAVRTLDIAFVVLFFIASFVSMEHSWKGWQPGQLAALLVILLYLPCRIIVAVADHRAEAAKCALYSFFTFAYVAAPLYWLWVGYNVRDFGYSVVLATFIFIWINDTGAYLSGRTFGRTKLCERLSPKKTWEGFWGGFALTMIAGLVTAQILYTGDDSAMSFTVVWVLYAAAVSIVGTFGDLFESLIKRTLGVKDSGTLIPGHGGILDRIDSLLAVAPLVMMMGMILAIMME